MTILRIHDSWGNKVILRGFFQLDRELVIPQVTVTRIMKKLRGLTQTPYFKGLTLDLCGPYDREIRIKLNDEGR